LHAQVSSISAMARAEARDIGMKAAAPCSGIAGRIRCKAAASSRAFRSGPAPTRGVAAAIRPVATWFHP
jgi:hypothetical protein